MTKRALAIGLAIAALIYSGPASANPTSKPVGSVWMPGPTGFLVRVRNQSTACVWVSVGISFTGHPWKWMGGSSTARFIHPGGYYDFADATYQLIPTNAEVKVEGTFMEHVNCTGAHIREITVENRSISIAGTPRVARASGYLMGHDRASYKVGVNDGIGPR